MMSPKDLFPKNASVRSSAHDMQIILDHASEGFVLIDRAGTILAFNRQAGESILKNIDGEVFIGRSIYDYVEPLRWKEYELLLNRVAEGETIEYSRCFTGQNHTKSWFEFRLSPVEENHSVNAICIRGREITKTKESQLLYYSLFEDDPLPKFVCERKTVRYLEVNEAAVKHYGYTREELLTMSVFNIRVEEQHDAVRGIIDNGPLSWDRSTIGQHRKKNGEVIQVQVALHPIDYKGTEATLVIVSDITQLLVLQEQLVNEKLSKQQEVTRATIETQEKERQMLGRELHDNVNQMLSSAKLFLGYAITEPEDKKHIVEKSIDTLDKAIQEIRKLSRGLMPPTLGDLGLQQAIRELLHIMPLKNGAIQLRGLHLLEKPVLPADMQLCIYRIIQEQLNNIIKYAECTRGQIAIERQHSALILTVSDNGKGFDVRAKNDGIGLQNIANRASAFSAEVNIESSPSGTKLTVRFPG